jgi:hypothetical protein
MLIHNFRVRIYWARKMESKTLPPGSVGAGVQAIRAVYVGRHELLPAQDAALKMLNIEIVKIVKELPVDIQMLRQMLRNLRNHADAVVTLALPTDLLLEIKDANFKVFMFRMNSSTVSNVAEAEAWVAQDPEWRTYIPAERPGEPIRVMEFAAIDEITEIKTTKQVWPIIDPPPIKPPSTSRIHRIYSKFIEILNLLLNLFN